MDLRRCTIGLLLTLCLGACRQAAPTSETTPQAATSAPGTTATSTLLPPAATTTQSASIIPAQDSTVPDEVEMARAAVLEYLSARYAADAPSPDLDWAGERTTPEGLVGAETFRYAAEPWIITVSRPVVPPDVATYQVVVSNSASSFQWQGEVTPSGDVTEFSAVSDDPVLSARDAALAFLSDQYSGSAPESDLTWTRRRMTPEGLLGAETFQYRSGFWVVTVSYPVVAPQDTKYRVLASNDSTGFQWQGEVLANGTVMETVSPIEGLAVVGWYGLVVGLPEGGQSDDYLALHPEGTGAIGLAGAEPAIEEQIQSLRDSNTYAHYWGTLVCGVADYNECQLTVSRLRPDAGGPLIDPDPVARWEGRVAETPEGASFDDYFVLAGAFPIVYGIDGSDPAIASQLEDLRDTQVPIRVWGRLTCGVPDVNSAQISVIAIEVLSGMTSAEPVTVEGWVGKIVILPPGAEYDDYFERDDGRTYGIDAAEEDMQMQVRALGTVGSRIRVWGQLLTNVPDVEGRQIQLVRYELEKPSELVDGWVGAFKGLEEGAQYDDYFEREDGQRFGVDTPDAKLAKRVEMLRDSESRVQVWGDLQQNVPDVENRQIRLTEIEIVD